MLKSWLGGQISGQLNGQLKEFLESIVNNSELE